MAAAPSTELTVTTPETGFRADIQGLRAVAVLAVVANHLIGWPTGGFLGVDVFFVISGFLITGLLLGEHKRSGRISLAGFYRRRARRILPAAAICLILVLAAAAVLYRTARFEAIAGDTLWSALFAANWHFAVVGTDYLGAAGPTSPLQHFWSLAVEEQFYLVWPVFVIGILWLVGRGAGRQMRSGTAVLGAVLTLAVVTSFGWATAETANSPTWAYFSTLSRGWEIAAGALLAVLANRLASVPAGLRQLMALGGLGMIAAGMLLINPAMAVPGPWSAVPVAGASLVIAAGIGARTKQAWALSNPVAQYVGRISYSLYLWHFPVIVLLATLLAAGPSRVVLSACLIVVLSVASFQVIEDPIRRAVRAGPIFRRSPPVVRSTRTLGIATVIAAVIAGGALIATTAGAAGTDRAASDAAQPGADAGTLDRLAGGDPGTQLSAELEAALQADEWPELTPEINGISETGRPPKDKECAIGLAEPSKPTVVHTGRLNPDGSAGRTVLKGTAADCAFGDPDAPRLAVVAGDSIGITWIPLVQELLAQRGYRIRGLTMSGCPFVGTDTENPAANVSALCPQHKAAVVEAIKQLKPDVVFISNTYRPRLAGRPDVADGAIRYAQGQLSIINEFNQGTTAVYVLAPPPPGKALEECATTFSTPTDCVSDIPNDWRQFNEAMKSGLVDAPKTHYVDTSSWFCTAAGVCPSFVGNTPMLRDAQGHIVPAYARKLAPVLDQFLATHGP